MDEAPRQLPAPTAIIALHVADDPVERELLEASLRTAAFEVDVVAAGSLAEAEEVVTSGAVFDVVLLDPGVPDSEGLAGVEEMLRVAPSTPVVVLTGVDDERLGLEAVRLGAQDYVVRDRLGPEVLSRTLRFAVERDALVRQARSLARIGAAGRVMGTAIGPFLEEVVTHLRTADPYLRTRLVVQQGQEVVTAGDEDPAGPEGRWRTPLPLPDSEPVRGHLLAWSVRPGDLRQSDVAFLHRVTDQVGDSIRAALTASSLEDRSRQLRALHGMVVAASDVTDRRPTQAELTASQAHLQMMLSQLPAVVWTVDHDLRLTSIRGAGTDALTSAPTAGDSLVEYFGEGEDALAIKEHRRALAGERRAYSFWWDGAWWQVALEPLVGDGGELLGVVGLALDTTPEKHALDEAERERARYRALFEHSTDVIILSDDEGRLVEVNPAGCELLGRPRDALLGRRVSEFLTLPEGAAGETLRRQGEQLRQQGNLIGTYLVAGSDGETREVEYSVSAGLRPGLYMAIGRDVTARRQFERALADSEQRFRSVAETATEGIFRLRLVPDRAYEYANPAIEQITGFTVDAILSDALLLRRRTHPDDVVDDVEPNPQRVRFQRADGEWRWLELRQVLLRSDRGDVAAVQGVVLDVTAEQQRADALREALQREQEATDELRRVAAMKDSFLRAVSHELRTPVTVVSGLATTLRTQRGRLAEGDVDTMFQRLEAHANRLGALLDDLLDIDRLTTTRKLKVQRERVDLHELVRRTAEEVELGHRVLRLDLAPTTAEVEPGKVERIVHNLLANAARHTPEGTTVHVTTGHDASGAATITVADDGPGIPVELRESVLEPFIQGPASADAANPGTGIGLSIVNEFTRLHGGDVAIDDGPHGGTSITVTLPLPGPTKHPGPTTRDPAAPPQTPPRGASTELASKRALLAVSRSIEAVAMEQAATGLDPMLVGLFQEPHYRAASEHVYRDIARHGGDVLLGHVGAAALPDLATLALPPGHPLGHEWTVLLAGPAVCAALVAHDTGTVGRGATIESARLFRLEISTAPEVVAAHLRRLVDEAGDTLDEDQRQRLRRAADRVGASGSAAGGRANQLRAALQEQVGDIDAWQGSEPLAMTDARTGAHTPAFLEEYLGLAGPRSPDVALIGFHVTSTGDPSIDLDHARAFADLVDDHSGPGDVLVHDGDERWHLLLPSTSEDAAEQLALTVLGTRLAQRLADDGASISAAVTVTAATDIDLGAIDQALHGVAGRHGELAHVARHPSPDRR